jgi:hypothetical protein
MHRIQSDKKELIQLLLETSFMEKYFLGKNANSKKVKEVVLRKNILKDHLISGLTFEEIAREQGTSLHKIRETYDTSFKKLKRCIESLDKAAMKS